MKESKSDVLFISILFGIITTMFIWFFVLCVVPIIIQMGWGLLLPVGVTIIFSLIYHKLLRSFND